MSFCELQPGRVAAYVAGHRARHRRWVLHHIPKTAGSSLSDELARHLPPYRNLAVAYDAQTGATHEAMDSVVEAFLAEPEGAWRSASGHVSARNVARIAEMAPDVGLATFLRHPVSRVVSEYRYCRTDRHPPHASFVARYPAIEDFVDDPAEANKMSFYLFGRRDLAPGEAMAALCRRYAFVGLQERYPLSFRLMSAMMWGGSPPEARSRVTPEGPENVIAMTPDLHARILAANALDHALYEAVFAIYAGIADEAWAMQAG